MKNGKTFLSILILGLSLGPHLIGGCNTTKSQAPITPPDTWGLPRTSPQNVIDNLTEAIAERDSVHYAAQLADSFHDVFQDNIEGPPRIWGKSDEVIAMSRLFRGAVNQEGFVGEAIGFTWIGTAPDTTTDFPAWTRIVMTDVNAIVNGRNRQTGNLLEYVVQGDRNYLWFEKNGSEWKVVRWEDNPYPAFSQEPVTFGIIKQLWRSGPLVPGSFLGHPDRR